MKTCSKCAVSKPLAEFHRRGDSDAHRNECKACINAQNMERYRTKPSTKASHQAAARKYQLKQYGITPEMYDEMHESQQGKCAICEKPAPRIGTETERPLAVDHCHETGRIRALLCSQCNSGIGMLSDSAGKLRRATAYLDLHLSRREV